MPSRIALLCTLTIVPGLLAAAVPSPPATSAESAVTIVRAPDTAVEGDQLSFRLKVRGVDRAKRVFLQERSTSLYGDPEWVTVRGRKVAGSSRHDFTATADGIDTESYRAVVTYQNGRVEASKPVTVKVWRWVPLVTFSSYYETYGISSNPYSQFDMNGKRYVGWYSYGSYAFWEARYTPGRNCRAFRAELGVRDESQDGSSGSISLLTEDGVPLFTSEALTPGMVQPIEIAMDRPYRFWVQATDTSPDELWALPAMGDPAFLCRGL